MQESKEKQDNNGTLSNPDNIKNTDNIDSDKDKNDNIEALWDKYFATGDEKIKSEIISHYLYIVNIVVKRMMPYYRDYSERDELINCGVLGLVDAVNKYDRSFGVKFQTYATSRIRGEIIDYMRKQDWAPTSLRKKINIIQEAYEVLEAKYNRKPTDEEISKYLGIKKSSVQKVLQKSHMFNLVSFESIVFEKNTDESESSMSEDPYQRLEDAVIYDALKKVVSELSERDKMLITLHYYEGLPLKNIADILGVSESRVSQLHSRILLDMKMALKKITG